MVTILTVPLVRRNTVIRGMYGRKGVKNTGLHPAVSESIKLSHCPFQIMFALVAFCLVLMSDASPFGVLDGFGGYGREGGEDLMTCS